MFISIFQHNKQIKSSQLHSWPKIAPTSSMTSQKQIIHWKSASMRSHMHWTWSKWIKSKHSNAAAVISPMQELHSVKEKIQLFGGKTTLNRGPHYLIETALLNQGIPKEMRSGICSPDPTTYSSCFSYFWSYRVGI